MSKEAIATSVEKELSIQNRPNLHVSIITCHTIIWRTCPPDVIQYHNKTQAESNHCLLFENSRWQPGTSFGRKAGFLSRCLCGPPLLICTVQTTLFSDVQMTRIIQSNFLPHYPQNFQIQQLCLSTVILLCLVHVYTCYTMV